MMKDWLSIGEFSKRTGFSNKALRIYEEKGLLVPHSRGENQYRFYSEEQVAVAARVQHYKALGFSLEQIKILLAETNESTLKELLERRLQESRCMALQLSVQITSLESILASLNAGHELTELERSQVMENLLEASIGNLKRRGFVDVHTHGKLSDEVSLFSSEMPEVVKGLRKIVEYARRENILLGPGRGTSPASLVLFAEGYSPLNPLQYGLLPELFSRTTYLHIETEYSRHREIGQQCDDLKAATGFDVTAYRAPLLDIFAEMKKFVGEVQFDNFADSDPMILEAPQRVGVRGLYLVEWNSNYHAWHAMPEAHKNSKDWMALQKWFENHSMKSAEDFINLTLLHERWSAADLANYADAKAPVDLPELEKTHGYMLFREDWIKILMRLTGVDVLTARDVLREISNLNAPPQRTVVDDIADDSIRGLMKKSAAGTFAKSHAITSWWYYKRTAILKSLWPKEYVDIVNRWEDKNGIIWQEFGYPLWNGEHYLKANG